MATDELSTSWKSFKFIKKYLFFEIYLVKENTSVFKKLMPSLHRFKEDLIITVDDDVLYP